MQYLDLTLDTPAADLACDEALLDGCEEGHETEILRFWEPQRVFVVLGCGNRVQQEVNMEACRASGVPILRRCSGGGAVLQGPGCLNFSLILKISETGPLRGITSTNQFIMETHRQGLSSLAKTAVQIQGFTDLTLGNLKFSGNAQRRKRQYLLFHGTFLLHFEIPLLDRYLAMPPRQPEYRKNRPHREFVRNAPIAPSLLKESLKLCWNATDRLVDIPHSRIERLVQQTYSTDRWNFKL